MQFLIVFYHLVSLYTVIIYQQKKMTKECNVQVTFFDRLYIKHPMMRFVITKQNERTILI
jgi:hypothetical protein